MPLNHGIIYIPLVYIIFLEFKKHTEANKISAFQTVLSC